MNPYQEMQARSIHTHLNVFQTQFTYWPVQIADFVVRLAEIPLPVHQLPIIGSKEAHRVVELSDEETVVAYNHINNLLNKFTPLHDECKNIIIQFFDIVFVPDATQQDVDVLCFEAFGNVDSLFDDYNPVVSFTQDHPHFNVPEIPIQGPEITPSRSSPKKKKQQSRRSKNYDTPIIRTSCSNCDEYTLRLKLLKKVSNMKMHDLLKVDSCIRGVRVENALMASLPPINEIDHKLHEKLIDTMEQRIQTESQYLEVTLPGSIDAIKLDWYQHMHHQQNPDLSVYVPETDPEDL